MATTPGLDFDLARGERFVRFSYAGPTSDVDEACALLGYMGAVTDSSAASSAGPPLAGLRVLDLSAVIAGPNCARYFADFGADVIKVEAPAGDSLRNMGWRDPRDGEGLWAKVLNRNKRTITLDLKAPADVDVLRRLVVDADVLVENFRPGTLDRLGLGPAVLHAINPTLVITSITGFGQTGPYASRPGFASIAESMSGFERAAR